MTLNEAVAEFEALFLTVKDGLLCQYCETGAVYVELYSGGIHREGAQTAAFASTEEAAVTLWLEAAKAYAKGKSGTLYWRVRPDISSAILLRDTSALVGKPELSVLDPIPIYRVRARLVIDDGEEKFDANSGQPIERIAS